MKLRLSDNSARIRLNQSEVRALDDEGAVSMKTEFPGGDLRCSIIVTKKYKVKLKEGHIQIQLPREVVREWARSEEISIHHFLDLGKGKQLRLLVEKDLKCRTERPYEDQSDAFPNQSPC